MSSGLENCLLWRECRDAARSVIGIRTHCVPERANKLSSTTIKGCLTFVQPNCTCATVRQLLGNLPAVKFKVKFKVENNRQQTV